MPVPNKTRDAGSGTTPFVVPCVEMFVSPLEIDVDPLKKPLPVLTVNCTVAPLTVIPVYHVPVKAPISV
jgi:hypothetical protein